MVKIQSPWYRVFSFGSNCSALCIILHNVTTPPAALTFEKTKLFIHEPRGTRVILNDIICRGNDLFGRSAYYRTSFFSSAVWHWSTSRKFLLPTGVLRAVGRSWNARCGCWWVQVHADGLCWVLSLQDGALVGTGFHSRKPGDRTPGIFTALK